MKKTTIELPDALLVAAKKRAAELGLPFRDLIEAGLRQQISSSGPQKPARRKKFRWVTAKGGLPPGVDLSDRAAMHDWLRKPL